MTNKYPDRDQFFAHKFVRLLTKSCAAQDIGLNAFSLLCIIAHTEDAARYRGPVRYWNEQLQNALAMSPKQLRLARDKAVEFGWLHYERDSKREVGRYWVTVPERAEGLGDAPIEEQDHGSYVPSHVTSEDNERDNERSHKGTLKGHIKGHSKVTSSIPIPFPSPFPEEGGTPAAVAEPPSEKLTEWQSEIIQAFNETFGTTARITTKRQAALKARWRDPWWRDNWRAALDRGSGSAFLRGANERGWVIDFEFFLKPDSVAKILEGKYDNRTGTQRPTASAAREQQNASTFDSLRRARERAGISVPASHIGGGSVAGRIAGPSMLDEADGGVD